MCEAVANLREGDSKNCDLNYRSTSHAMNRKTTEIIADHYAGIANQDSKAKCRITRMRVSLNFRHTCGGDGDRHSKKEKSGPESPFC